jgi:hypothetical protein
MSGEARDNYLFDLVHKTTVLVPIPGNPTPGIPIAEGERSLLHRTDRSSEWLFNPALKLIQGPAFALQPD